MNPTPMPVGLQMLKTSEYICLELETNCFKLLFGVSSREHGTMFTIKKGLGWYMFFIKDMQGSVLGAIRPIQKLCLREALEVQIGGLPPVRIQHKGGLSRSFLIVDYLGQQIKLKPTGIFSKTYEILGQNLVKLGELKGSTFGWEYNISCPKDLDVRYKMALISAPLFMREDDSF